MQVFTWEHLGRLRPGSVPILIRFWKKNGGCGVFSQGSTFLQPQGSDRIGMEKGESSLHGHRLGEVLLVSRSVHKEFLWSGVAVGHNSWACIPDNTYSVLTSGDLCQSTQKMGLHRAQVSKPLALETHEETGVVGPWDCGAVHRMFGCFEAARGRSSGCQATLSPPVLRNNGHTWDSLAPPCDGPGRCTAHISCLQLRFPWQTPLGQCSLER